MALKRRERRTQKTTLFRAFFITLFILLLGIFTWWVTRTDKYIKNIVVITSEPENTEMVKSYIQEYLDTPLLFGITKKKHQDLVNLEKLKTNLLDLFPLYQESSLALFDRDLIVELSSRKSVALWCEERINKEEKCWFIDSERIIFRESPVFSEGVYIKYLSKLHKTPAIGEPVLDKESRLYSAQIIKILEERGLEPTRVSIETEDRILFYVQKILDLKVPQESRIIVSKSQEAGIVRDRLEILLNTPEFVEELTLYPQKFDYADLRFPGRLVYRLSDE